MQKIWTYSKAVRLKIKRAFPEPYSMSLILANLFGIYAILHCFVIILFGFPEGRNLEQEQIILSLMAGIATSYFLYLYTIVIPQRIIRRIKKRSYVDEMWEFKRDLIESFLSKLGIEANQKLIEDLLDLKKFKLFFKEEYSVGQSRYDFIATEIDNDSFFRNSIIVKLEILKEQTTYIISSLDIPNAWAFNFLKHISTVVIIIKNDAPHNNDYLMAFLWELFTGWSYLDGYTDQDLIREIAESI